jgi:hypothetical protein
MHRLCTRTASRNHTTRPNPVARFGSWQSTILEVHFSGQGPAAMEPPAVPVPRAGVVLLARCTLPKSAADLPACVDALGEFHGCGCFDLLLVAVPPARLPDGSSAAAAFRAAAAMLEAECKRGTLAGYGFTLGGGDGGDGDTTAASAFAAGLAALRASGAGPHLRCVGVPAGPFAPPVAPALAAVVALAPRLLVIGEGVTHSRGADGRPIR